MNEKIPDSIKQLIDVFETVGLSQYSKVNCLRRIEDRASTEPAWQALHIHAKICDLATQIDGDESRQILERSFDAVHEIAQDWLKYPANTEAPDLSQTDRICGLKSMFHVATHKAAGRRHSLEAVRILGAIFNAAEKIDHLDTRFANQLGLLARMFDVTRLYLGATTKNKLNILEQIFSLAEKLNIFPSDQVERAALAKGDILTLQYECLGEMRDISLSLSLQAEPLKPLAKVVALANKLDDPTKRLEFQQDILDVHLQLAYHQRDFISSVTVLSWAFKVAGKILNLGARRYLRARAFYLAERKTRAAGRDFQALRTDPNAPKLITGFDIA